MKRVSLTKIRNILKDCVFDPKKASTMQPVIELIIENPDYAINKAIEMLKSIKYYSNEPSATGAKIAIIQHTIQVLALRLANEPNEIET